IRAAVSRATAGSDGNDGRNSVVRRCCWATREAAGWSGCGERLAVGDAAVSAVRLSEVAAIGAHTAAAERLSAERQPAAGSDGNGGRDSVVRRCCRCRRQRAAGLAAVGAHAAARRRPVQMKQAVCARLSFKLAWTLAEYLEKKFERKFEGIFGWDERLWLAGWPGEIGEEIAREIGEEIRLGQAKLIGSLLADW
ncbi:hypothetical protein BC831DRAFT_495654, partial [Entophlyctis helioformis]